VRARVIKIVVGATLAIIFAEVLGLKYSLSAGVIVILSIYETKKKSLDIALLRLKSTVLALAIGSLAFLILGFHAVAFGVYLLCFLPLAFKFKLNDGIGVSSVLVTHLLSEGYVSVSLLVNELWLMGIGAGLAIMLNLYMPNMLPQIKKDQNQIEQMFREILLFLSDKARHQINDVNEEALFASVKELLVAAEQRAKKNRENYILAEMTYYTQYMRMRFQQFEVLLRLSKLLDQVAMPLDQTDLIADLTEQFAQTLHEFNPGNELMEQTDHILDIFRQQSLPQTRAEFENRAQLFQYLNEFRYLLELKRDFIDHLTVEEMEVVLKETIRVKSKAS